MEFHQLKCPNCSATLDYEDGLDILFCKYCGTRIIISGQSDAAFRAKADIRKAELEKDIRLKELELKEHERQDEFKGLFFIRIVLALIALLPFILILIKH